MTFPSGTLTGAPLDLRALASSTRTIVPAAGDPADLTSLDAGSLIVLDSNPGPITQQLPDVTADNVGFGVTVANVIGANDITVQDATTNFYSAAALGTSYLLAAGTSASFVAVQIDATTFGWIVLE